MISFKEARSVWSSSEGLVLFPLRWKHLSLINAPVCLTLICSVSSVAQQLTIMFMNTTWLQMFQQINKNRNYLNFNNVNCWIFGSFKLFGSCTVYCFYCLIYFLFPVFLLSIKHFYFYSVFALDSTLKFQKAPYNFISFL